MLSYHHRHSQIVLISHILKEQKSKELSEISQNFERSKNSDREDDYEYIDYECDYCRVSPIRRVRFHCKIYEDFDLCERWYRKKR